MVTSSVVLGAPPADEATGVPSALNTWRSKSLAGFVQLMPMRTMSVALAAPTVRVNVSQVELLQLGASRFEVTLVCGAAQAEKPHHETVGEELLTVPDDGVAAGSGDGGDDRTPPMARMRATKDPGRAPRRDARVMKGSFLHAFGPGRRDELRGPAQERRPRRAARGEGVMMNGAALERLREKCVRLRWLVTACQPMCGATTPCGQ